MNRFKRCKTYKKKSIAVSMRQLEPLTVDEEMELVRLQKSENSWTANIKLVTEKKQADAKIAEKKEEWEESLRKRRRKCKTLTGKIKLVEQRISLHERKIRELHCDNGGISYSKYRSEHFPESQSGKKVPYHFHQVIDDARHSARFQSGQRNSCEDCSTTRWRLKKCRCAALQDSVQKDLFATVWRLGVDDDKICHQECQQEDAYTWTISLPPKSGLWLCCRQRVGYNTSFEKLEERLLLRSG